MSPVDPEGLAELRKEIDAHVRKFVYGSEEVEIFFGRVSHWVRQSLLNDGSAEAKKYLPIAIREVDDGRASAWRALGDYEPPEPDEEGFFSDLRPSEFEELDRLLDDASETFVYQRRDPLIEVFVDALVEFARRHPEAWRVTPPLTREGAS